MRQFIAFVLGVIIGLFFVAAFAKAATSVLPIFGGGTGTSTTPAYGKVLVGGSSGEYEFAATSTFGSASGGGISWPWTISATGFFNQLAEATTTQAHFGASPISLSASSTSQFDNSTTTFATLGTLWNTGITSALGLYDASHKEGAYGGSSCTNQVPTSMSAVGAWTCSSVSDSFLTGQMGLAHGGTNASLSGASQIVFVNSGNTALTTASGYTLSSSLATLPNASTTNLTASSELVIPSGSSKGSTVAGQVELDTTNDQLKAGDGSATAVLDQRRFLTFTYATSTAWTGTTTLALGTYPAAMTLTNVQCYTNVGTLEVRFYYGPTPTSQYLSASSTPGVLTWSSSNAPGVAATSTVDVGNPATSPTSVSCTLTGVVQAT
jgi:hypothetical protein